MRLLIQNIVRAGTATIVLLAVSLGVARADSALEYRVKAAFLYNFAKFVEWPHGALANDEAPISICLVGQDPFGQILDRTLKGRKIQGRDVLVRRGQEALTLGHCHVIFVGQTIGEPLARVMQRVAATGVLTVGESDAFYDLGGIIRFIVEDGKVRFDVNLGEAELAGFKVSSQLLRLARTVDR